jgi:predicted amidophosphoribosyltransferase
LLSFFEKLLFDDLCKICGRPLEPKENFVCTECLLKLRPCDKGCPSADIPFISEAQSAFNYDDTAKEIVRLIKFEGARGLATAVGKIAAPFLKRFSGEIFPDVITFIPTNPWRLWFLRGFDPTYELLKPSGVKVEKLVRRRWLLRKPLARSSSVKERKKLVKGAFTLDPEGARFLKGKRVLLIDDLLTSGSTATEIALLFRSVGVKEIFLFTFFRAGM